MNYSTCSNRTAYSVRRATPSRRTKPRMTAIASWSIIAVGNAGPSSTSSPARSLVKVATPVRSSCKSCAELLKACPLRTWLPSYTSTAVISYAVATPSTRCFSSAFPPSPLADPTQESDEVYVNAGEKGWKQADPARPPRRRANQRKGHGTWTNDRPPIQGIVGRASGQIRVRVLRHSTAAELRPLIEATVPVGSTLNTDEWRGYSWVAASGRTHQTVNHSPGTREWARDEDGDGVREVHSNTIEGLWTGLRNHLRPLRGVNKWFLAGYVAVFEWAHNLKVVTSEFVAMMIVPFTPKPS
jgi:transposase